MTLDPTFLGEGWAVRLTVGGGKPWVNDCGGYEIARHRRRIWNDYDDALDAAHDWDSLSPVIVRIVYRRSTQRQGDGGRNG